MLRVLVGVRVTVTGWTLGVVDCVTVVLAGSGDDGALAVTGALAAMGVLAATGVLAAAGALA
ncbi:hypothetical protein BRPE64_ACDS11440 [Caballeronia insecticola]|uniref:Uncharacterized protein n=1 Tax=Caballeronia insecticola TaxID=758793 RepID=R4WGA2_9BURK|nr:hypothetical protein BRPE64_ACDS11440 [Caballeronia insecticola]